MEKETKETIIFTTGMAIRNAQLEAAIINSIKKTPQSSKAEFDFEQFKLFLAVIDGDLLEKVEERINCLEREGK